MNFSELSFQDFLKLDTEAKREWFRWAIDNSNRARKLEQDLQICRKAIAGQTSVQKKEKGRGTRNQ